MSTKPGAMQTSASSSAALLSTIGHGGTAKLAATATELHRARIAVAGYALGVSEYQHAICRELLNTLGLLPAADPDPEPISEPKPTPAATSLYRWMQYPDIPNAQSLRSHLVHAPDGETGRSYCRPGDHIWIPEAVGRDRCGTCRRSTAAQLLED